MVSDFSPPPPLCSISHLLYILTAGALTEVLLIQGTGNSRREFILLEAGAVKTRWLGWILPAGCGWMPCTGAGCRALFSRRGVPSSRSRREGDRPRLGLETAFRFCFLSVRYLRLADRQSPSLGLWTAPLPLPFTAAVRDPRGTETARAAPKQTHTQHTQTHTPLPAVEPQRYTNHFGAQTVMGYTIMTNYIKTTLPKPNYAVLMICPRSPKPAGANWGHTHMHPSQNCYSVVKYG